MKNLRNALLIGLSFLAFNSSAQMSLGAGLGILKSTEDNTEALLGGELSFKYDFSDAFRAGINLGYYQTSEKIGSTKFTSSLTPISVSGEYLFLSNNFRPYVGLHLGLLRAGYKVSGSNGSNSNSNFSLAPVLGAEYAISDQLGINFNFKYAFVFYENYIKEIEITSTLSPNIGVYFKL